MSDTKPETTAKVEAIGVEETAKEIGIRITIDLMSWSYLSLTRQQVHFVAERIAQSPYLKGMLAQLAAAERERDAARDDVSHQTFMGNSIQHWYAKAKCYGDIVHGCSPALEAAGFPVDRFSSDGAVGGIARAVNALKAAYDAARAEASELRRELDKLPKTRDAVTISPEMEVWINHPGDRSPSKLTVVMLGESASYEQYGLLRVFSTYVAAESALAAAAARGEGAGK